LPPLPKVIDHEGLPLQGVVTYVSLKEAFATGQNEIKGSTFVWELIKGSRQTLSD